MQAGDRGASADNSATATVGVSSAIVSGNGKPLDAGMYQYRIHMWAESVGWGGGWFGPNRPVKSFW